MNNKILIVSANYYKEISIKESNRFSISHLGTVNNQKKLLIHQSNNLIIDVNIQDLEDTYHDAAQFCWGKASSWISKSKVFDTYTNPVVIPSWRYVVC